jgi:hypothetical protein
VNFISTSAESCWASFCVCVCVNVDFAFYSVRAKQTKLRLAYHDDVWDNRTVASKEQRVTSQHVNDTQQKKEERDPENRARHR